MNKKQLETQKKILFQLKSDIINRGLLQAGEDLCISPEDLADETDLATSVINQEVSFNIRQRELMKLRQIDAALLRISEGTYGTCLECGDSIGVKRLGFQPFTTLCIVHAEERERQSNLIHGYA